MVQTDHFRTNRTETKLPENLLAELIILPNPVQYSAVKKRLEKCEAIDQEAEALSYLERTGVKVLNIPEPQEALPEITPDENGVLRDVKQIQRYLQEERRGENRVFDLACAIIIFYFNHGRNPEDIRKEFLDDSEDKIRRDGGAETPVRVLLKYYIQQFSYLKDFSLDEIPKFIMPLKQQVSFALDHFTSVNSLRTPKERIDSELQANQEKIDTTLREREEREEKQQAREQDPAEAKKFLIGLARGALERNNKNVRKAAEEVLQNKNTARYIEIHSISIAQLIQERQETRDRNNRDRGIYSQLPFAVLLSAFEQPRTVTQTGSAPEFIVDSLKLGLDARFTAELPAGIYDNVVDKQEAYHAKRANERDRRNTFLDLPEDFDWDEARRNPELAPYIQKFDTLTAAPVTSEFDLCRNNPEIALAWWNLPDFKRWEYLRNGIYDLMRAKRIQASEVYGNLQAQIKTLEEKKKRIAIVLAPILNVTPQTVQTSTLKLAEYVQTHIEIYETPRESGWSLFLGIPEKPVEPKPKNEQKDQLVKAFSQNQSEIESLQTFAEEFKFQFVISGAERNAIIRERQSTRQSIDNRMGRMFDFWR